MFLRITLSIWEVSGCLCAQAGMLNKKQKTKQNKNCRIQTYNETYNAIVKLF